MKKIITFISLLLTGILIFPLTSKAITVDEARIAVVRYANFAFEEQYDEIRYEYPVQNISSIYKGKYNVGDKFQMDCNTFVTFTILNAFHANDKSEVISSSSNQVFGTNFDKWVTHSKYYNGTKYDFIDSSENVKTLATRIDLVSLLEPGDVIGINAFKEDGDECTHTAIYVGDGYMIHNSGSGGPGGSKGGGGLKKSKIPSEISFASRHGKYEDGKVKGGITILKLKNTEDLPISITESIRYYDGYGNVKYKSVNGSVNENSSQIPADSSEPSNNVDKPVINYENEHKKLAYLVGMALLVIRIAVPVLLILIASIELVKAMTEKEGEMSKTIKGILPKVLSAIMIFLLPSIVALIMTLVNKSDEWNEYANCITNPASCEVEMWN